MNGRWVRKKSFLDLQGKDGLLPHAWYDSNEQLEAPHHARVQLAG